MPVDFLTDEQSSRYGRFNEAPSSAQLARYFYLDQFDLQRVRYKRPEAYLRLGYAIQLGTVRFLGAFLEMPLEVPENVIAFLADQLRVTDWSDLPRYAKSEARFDHKQDIQSVYGYREFSDPAEQFALMRWLYTRAWYSAERPVVLFDLATARLVKRKVLLPGVTTLERFVARIRDQVAERLWHRLFMLLDEAQSKRLLQLLDKVPGSRFSRLELLQRSPTRQSTPGLLEALQRLQKIRELGVGHLDLSMFPPSRLHALARYAATVWTQSVVDLTPERQLATLLAFAYSFEAVAMDEAMDIFDIRMNDLLGNAVRVGKRERLRTLKDLDAAALRLSQVGEILLNMALADASVRERIFEQIPAHELQRDIETVHRLTRLPEDGYHQELIDCYQQLRRFLPTLLKTITFGGTSAADDVLAALEFLREAEVRRGKLKWDTAPSNGFSRLWQRLVRPDQHVDKRAYTVCVLQHAHQSLRRHDLFVSPSARWGDARIKLLRGEEWEKARPQICRALDRFPSATPELEQLTYQLNTAYQRVSLNLSSNLSVRVENGTDLIVSNLDRLEEPDSLLEARERVDNLMPWVDLPDLVMEIAKMTNFTADFTHISEGQARVENLELSICAVLVAEACNVGLRPVVNEDNPALTLDRLAWVQQNYIRAETISQANARLVDAQKHLELAQIWGGGEVASADGLRFVVPVRTLNARPNSHYFGAGRGVTYFNFTSDQFTGFYAILIPGTLRDSLYILEGLLEQQTSLRPTEIMTDTASYSDVVFGLFWLLGYQFSPRLADIGAARFWRIDPHADYGQLNSLARYKIDVSLIEKNWDDFLRVAGSLKLGTINATLLMQTLQGGSRASTLSKAIAELGRIAKTLYLLAYIDDEAYRRRILTQLNRGEGRHALARAIFHGQRGQLRQRYREGQEDQLSALGLVANAVVLWNTIYMDAAVKALQSRSFSIARADLERLSPLSYGHINLLGHYTFSLHEGVQQGQLRPLRTPKQLDLLRRSLL